MRLTAHRGLVLLAFGVSMLGAASRSEAQLGALLSPGPLTKSHTKLEGAANCTECHERGRGVSAARCLTCHEPVAQRIARKVGIHRTVTDDCVQCHVEHHGVDGELRPFNVATFDHTRDTAFRLDGKHAAPTTKCETCHKTRSFLAVKTACASCHADVHKGALGSSCETCHSTSDPFTEARTFDHARTRFPLTGAHQAATCASCHKSPTFTGVAFASCASCHQNPHTPALPGTCSSCHGTETWRTRRFDHARTDFPLAGAHADLSCASCHKTSALRETRQSTTCASCHTDPHAGEFKEDCGACHTETSFAGGTFDHTAKTTFALTDGHAGLKCVACHTDVRSGGPAAKVSADFRGLTTSCVSCHDDPHDADLGTSCETCHSTAAFTVTSFVHPRAEHLFEAAHATVACDACHTPARVARTGRTAMAGRRFTETPTECVSCHKDVHLGQVNRDCAVCHSTNTATFAIDRFDHARATFTLTGAHITTTCDDCHKEETAAFPAGAGTAVRFTGMTGTCVSCHKDVHLGQLDTACETCHDTASFDLKTYTHKSRDPGFFTGPHLDAECATCHKPVERRFSSGTGRAVDFKVSKTCVGCHTDVHRGAMGNNCQTCHRVARLKSSHDTGPAFERTLLLALHRGIAP